LSKLVLPIDLHKSQRIVDNSQARFKVVKAGRRWGKTRYISYWLTKRALTTPGKHWYVSKTLDLARDEIWPILLDFIPKKYIEHIDKRTLTITLKIGKGLRSYISTKSSEKEDNLRGRGLASLALDEASFVRPSLWNLILRPMLADCEAPALIFSSPKSGWFTRQWAKAKAGRLPGWEAFQFSIYDNPLISRDEIEEVKQSVPENVWRQEYLGEEVEDIGLVYSEFDNENICHALADFPDYKSWPTVVGIDWGWDAPTAVGWLHVRPSDGLVLLSTEHQRSGWSVRKHADAIKLASRGLNIGLGNYVLDRSAFKAHSDSRESIADKFHDNGINCIRSEKDFSSQIDTMKHFINARMFRVASNCVQTIRGFQDWEWRSHEPDVLAAVRYALTLIRQRRISKFAQGATLSRPTSDPEPVDLQYRLPPVRESGPVQWNFESGAPY